MKSNIGLHGFTANNLSVKPCYSSFKLCCIILCASQGLSQSPVRPSFWTDNCHLKQAEKSPFQIISHHFRPFQPFLKTIVDGHYCEKDGQFQNPSQVPDASPMSHVSFQDLFGLVTGVLCNHLSGKLLKLNILQGKENEKYGSRGKDSISLIELNSK